MNRGVWNCIGFSLIIYVCVIYCDFILIYYEFVPKFKIDRVTSLSMSIYYHLIIVLLLASHLRVLFSNPGKITAELRSNFADTIEAPLEPVTNASLAMISRSRAARTIFNWTFCYDCQLMRPPRSFHCRSCKCCVMRMDHHCEWINNCVGASNQKYFIQAVFYGFLYSTSTIFLIMYALFSPASISKLRYMHYFYAFLVSMNFAISTFTVFYSQICSVIKDQTAMEAVNLRFYFHEENRTVLSLLKDVFGPSHFLCWILPCSKTKKIYIEHTGLTDTEV